MGIENQEIRKAIFYSLISNHLIFSYITSVFLVVTFAFLVVTEFFLVVTEIQLAFT